MRRMLVGLFILVGASGCIWDILGGVCQYADTTGTATIVAVDTAPTGELNCANDAVKVLFDFVPTDAASSELGAESVQLTIGEGYNPSREWVEGSGIAVGSQLACTRRDMVRGSCTPTLYEFSELDTEAAVASCNGSSSNGFSISVIPSQVEDAVVGQRCVFLVTVDEGDDGGGGDVTVVASADDAEVIVESGEIRAGEVCEVTIIPSYVGEISEDPYDEDYSYGRGYPIDVTIMGERNGVQQSASAEVNLLSGEDTVEEEAAGYRDRFVEWLAENHTELGITEETEWTPTIVAPHILIVTHYLFFSDEWEMGLTWHVMIPPYDWARIYLRHRYDSTVPQYAYEISSLQAEPVEVPHEYDVPEEVDR